MSGNGRPSALSHSRAAALVLAVAVLGPVLAGRGFVLVYDMVFVPRQPLLPAGLGLGAALPRAVPADAVLALVSHVLPGDVLQKLALAAALVAAATGAARLVPAAAHPAVRVVAAAGYTWNAFVAERLFIGHWPVLLAYGALPWIVWHGLAVRRGAPRAWPRLVLAMVPAALGPTGGLLAGGAAVAAAGWRRAAPALGVALLLNAPWWVPALLRPAGALSDPGAVAAFAARGESWGGPVLAALGLGGIWNAEVVPASRESPLAPVFAVLVAAVALYGCRRLARAAPAGWGVAPARAVLVLGALGLLVGVAGAVPPLDAGLRWAVQAVPGAGLLRDGQRFVAWWALVVAVGGAAGVDGLARRMPDALGRGAALAGAALLPIAVLPDLAWGGLGRLQPATYPADWAAVAGIVRHEPADVLVLPFMTYRAFEWNGYRTQLDPAPRWLPATTVTDDTLPVGQELIGGEDPRAAATRRALAAGTPPERLGVGWVLVERGTPGELPAWLGDLRPQYDGRWLALYRVAPAAAAGTPPVAATAAPAVPVLVADGAALALSAGAMLWLLLPAGRGPVGRR